MRATSWAIALAAFAWACGNEDASTPATDIVLSPEPGLNSTGQVLSKVDRIQVILDREDGLYPPCAPVDYGNGLELKNVDGDPECELTRNITIAGWDHLPVVRLEPGRFEGATIDIRVKGTLPDGRDAAFGEQARQRLPTAGQGIFRSLVGFNLTDENLPPRVVDDGVEIVGGSCANPCACPRLRVTFTRDLDPDSVARTPAQGTMDCVTGREVCATCAACTGLVSPQVTGSVATWEIAGLAGRGEIPLVNVVVRPGTIAAADEDLTLFDQFPDDSPGSAYEGLNLYRAEPPFTLCPLPTGS